MGHLSSGFLKVLDVGFSLWILGLVLGVKDTAGDLGWV